MLDRAFSEVEARAVAGWSYEPPFDLYDQDSDHPEVFLARGPAGEGYYPAIDRYGELVAFAVFGAEARVLGQQQMAGTLDVGLGVRPDMTSRGVGTELLGSVVARVGRGAGRCGRWGGVEAALRRGGVQHAIPGPVSAGGLRAGVRLHRTR